MVRQAGDSHAWVVAPGPASFPTPARAVKPGGESDGPGRPACAAEACGREQEAANRGRATRRAVLAGPGPRVIA